MQVSEALVKASHGIGAIVTVHGYLVVADAFAYLSESQRSESQSSSPAIMVVWPGLADALLDAGAPVSVGSMVLFAGDAEVCGTLNKTGMGLVSAAIHTVTRVTYMHDGEDFNVEPNRT
jgi:hypothetical protein